LTADPVTRRSDASPRRTAATATIFERWITIELKGEFSMARNNQSGGRNNNPSGRNQYSSDWMDSVRDRPMASAAAAAAAVGAGVFLWSKRNQISEQISRLGDQISDWSEERGWAGNSGETATAGARDSTATETSGSSPSRSGRTTSGKSARASRSTQSQSASSGQAMNAGSASQGIAH
jgi:hypothetical protein